MHELEVSSNEHYTSSLNAVQYLQIYVMVHAGLNYVVWAAAAHAHVCICLFVLQKAVCPHLNVGWCFDTSGVSVCCRSCHLLTPQAQIQELKSPQGWAEGPELRPRLRCCRACKMMLSVAGLVKESP
jgi:hypothetical protein